METKLNEFANERQDENTSALRGLGTDENTSALRDLGTTVMIAVVSSAAGWAVRRILRRGSK